MFRGNASVSAQRRRIRGKLFGGDEGRNPICLFTLEQSQIRTIDTLGLVLESKYGSRRRGEGGWGCTSHRGAARVNLPHGPLHSANMEA